MSNGLDWFRRAIPPVNAVYIATRTDRTIRGFLVDKRSDGIILRAASIGTADQNGVVTWQKLDGDVVVPMENIDYWQEALPPEAITD